MSNSQDQIRARVEEFVEELSGLVREAALESVREALEGKSTRRAKPRAAAPAAIATTTAAPKATRATRGGKKGGKRARRSPDEMANIQTLLVNYISANPGQRIEQIAPGVSMSSKQLARPAKLLIEQNRLKTKGQKRSTTYYAR